MEVSSENLRKEPLAEKGIQSIMDVFLQVDKMPDSSQIVMPQYVVITMAFCVANGMELANVCLRDTTAKEMRQHPIIDL
jgi:hypothetical protein